MSSEPGGVSETMYFCLYARALESKQADAIIRDPRAVEIADALSASVQPFRPSAVAQVGIAARTALIDRLLGEILERHPQAVVVNLGAGLCTRSFRMPAGWSQWFDVDLPEVEATWARWIGATDRRTFVAASLVEPDWIARVVRPGRHHVFIAEGSLMYLERDDVRAVLDRLSAACPGADAIVETLGPLCIPLARIQRPIARTGARFRWGVWSARRLEAWCPGVRFLDEYSLLDEHHDRWGVLRHLARIPALRRQLNVAHLRFIERPVS